MEGKICLCALSAWLMMLGVSAEDALHWIGLDTTLRDQKVWVAPVQTVCASSLDTQVADVWTSAGETVRGTFAGLFLLFR